MFSLQWFVLSSLFAGLCCRFIVVVVLKLQNKERKGHLETQYIIQKVFDICSFFKVMSRFRFQDS
jgi:hypothetical protein